MKILAPINSSREVEPLIENGAREFYCGFVPEGWESLDGGNHPINKRDKDANVSSLKDLKELVYRAHEHDVPVFLATNASQYILDQYEILINLLKKAYEEIGIDAFLISDIGLLLTLENSGLSLPIHMSTIGSCFNSKAAALFKNMGVSRIVLPRQLSLSEVIDITSSMPDMPFEVFIINGRCVYNDGFCMTNHELGCFCTDSWSYYFFNDREKNIKFKDNMALRENLTHFETWHSPFKIIGDLGLPGRSKVVNTGCGICALSILQRHGIHSIKIVGREFPTKLKLKSVKIVKDALDVLEKEPIDFLKKMKSAQIDPDLCESGYMCYYPDFNDHLSQAPIHK
jgi:putative protease